MWRALSRKVRKQPSGDGRLTINNPTYNLFFPGWGSTLPKYENSKMLGKYWLTSGESAAKNYLPSPRGKWALLVWEFRALYSVFRVERIFVVKEEHRRQYTSFLSCLPLLKDTINLGQARTLSLPLGKYVTYSSSRQNVCIGTNPIQTRIKKKVLKTLLALTTFHFPSIFRFRHYILIGSNPECVEISRISSFNHSRIIYPDLIVH